MWDTNAHVTDVYTEAVQPLIETFLEGYNAALICVGESGSGKTHTICGSSVLHAGRSTGVVPRGPLHGGVADLLNTDVHQY